MPEVTVWPSPNGLPIASTKSPTCSRSESPIGTAVRLLGRDLQHRDIGFGVAADQLGRETPVVLGRDLDPGRVLDDMRRWSARSRAPRRRSRPSRSPGSRAARTGVLRQVEEPAEKRVLQQRVLFAHPAAHGDIDHPRRDARQHRREARDKLAPGLRDRRGRVRVQPAARPPDRRDCGRMPARPPANNSPEKIRFIMKTRG